MVGFLASDSNSLFCLTLIRIFYIKHPRLRFPYTIVYTELFELWKNGMLWPKIC